MMDKNDKPDIIDPMLATESTDATEPAEPMDRIEPAEPMDRIDPVEPMLSNEPAEPADDELRRVAMLAFSQHGHRFRLDARPGFGIIDGEVRRQP